MTLRHICECDLFEIVRKLFNLIRLCADLTRFSLSNLVRPVQQSICG